MFLVNFVFYFIWALFAVDYGIACSIKDACDVTLFDPSEVFWKAAKACDLPLLWKYDFLTCFLLTKFETKTGVLQD